MVNWTYRYFDDGIQVFLSGHDRGKYEYLPEKHCDKCSYPTTTIPWCLSCADLYGFNKIYALGIYRANKNARGEWDHPLSSHIRFLKKKDIWAEPLGHALSYYIDKKYFDLSDSNYIVPIPAHQNTIKSRGYNQAEMIAREVSKYHGISLIQPLDKILDIELRDLGRAERFEAVKKSYIFKQTHKKQITGSKILLIDDVVTTGATVSQCSEILRNNGATEVNVAILGRTYG